MKNCAKYTRLSLDVRWQPVADDWDDRYVRNSHYNGETWEHSSGDKSAIDKAVAPPPAAAAGQQSDTISWEEMKQEWGLPTAGSQPAGRGIGSQPARKAWEPAGRE